MNRGSVKTRCQQCDCMFFTFPYILKNGYGKFCGMTCYGNSKKGMAPTPTQLASLKKGHGWNKGVKGLYSNEKHPQWKGDEASYVSIHMWLKRNYGSAKKCENKNCQKKSSRFEWAKLRDKNYSHNRSHFVQLCKSCHTNYDSYKRKITV